MTIRDGGVEGVGWNWTLSDFIAMGVLLFVTGLAIDFAARKLTKPINRSFALAIIAGVFLLTWAELAVGAVSQLVNRVF